MKVITRKPGEEAQVEEWDTIELDAMQKAVGGYICIALQAHGYVVWCDDEGLMKADPQLNFHRPTDGARIVGPILVTGGEDRMGETQGLSDVAVTRTLARLRGEEEWM